MTVCNAKGNTKQMDISLSHIIIKAQMHQFIQKIKKEVQSKINTQSYSVTKITNLTHLVIIFHCCFIVFHFCEELYSYRFCLHELENCDSSVSIVTVILAGLPGFDSQKRQEIFFSPQHSCNTSMKYFKQIIMEMTRNFEDISGVKKKGKFVSLSK
jgi:hypothetical protein